jgi:AraC-like DNA-binding protein
MPQLATTTSNQFWGFIQLLSKRGVEVTPYVEDAKLAKTAVTQPYYKLPTLWVYQCIANMAESLQIAHLGWQVGWFVGHQGLQQISERALQESTLDKVLKMVCQLTHHGASHADFFIKETDQYYEFCHVGGVDLDTAGYAYVEQYISAVMLSIIRAVLGAIPFSCDYLKLRTQLKVSIDSLNQNTVDEKLSIGAVFYGQTYTSVSIPKALWDTQNCYQAKRTLSALTGESASPNWQRPILRRISQNNRYIENLLEVLIPYLGNAVPELSDIAQLSQISSRSLQRYLAKHNTSYNRLILNLRMEFARYYVQHEQRSVNEISKLLGYSTANHLSRAYKKYYNISMSREEL